MAVENTNTLATKYRPKSFGEVVEQGVVTQMLEKICSADQLACRNFLLIGPAGCGKAQPLYSKVLTPSGYINMGDVQVGTSVYTHSGAVASVCEVYPQGKRAIYEICLVDGSCIRVADNHLNVIYTNVSHPTESQRVVTTEELIANYADSAYGLDKSWPMNSVVYVPVVSDMWPSVDPRLTGKQISHICYIGDEECQCIMVDHPDHTYVSDNNIVTHNTTSARIMASMLNKGRGDPIELDAASNNGVESVRNLVEQARSYPVGCDWKVFILDEAHAFTPVAWQSFLKTLESAPAKSVFIFCTTNPEKIPATILSRVQTFQLSKISLDGIESRIKAVLDTEIAQGRTITYTDDAISYIAKLANGGMRDALTLTDKALAYSENITSEGLSQALSLPSYDDYFTLLGAYSKKNNKVIAETIHKVYNSGVNFVKWMEGFHSFVINIVKYIFLKDINATMIPSYYQDKIAKYGAPHAAICLKLANKMVKMNSELKTTQYLQELALTYLLFVPSKEGQ